MLLLGGLNAYTFVWDLADLGIGLMTIFNIFALFLLTKEAVNSLKNYKELLKTKKWDFAPFSGNAILIKKFKIKPLFFMC